MSDKVEAVSQRSKRSKEKKKSRSKGMIGILTSKFFLVLAVLMTLLLILLMILPVYRIEDDSMYPTLREGDLVIAVPLKPRQGDVVAIRQNRMLLIRRVISTGGNTVDINSAGRFYVNTILLEEDYIDDFDKGICDIDLPYEVPNGRLFVAGDNRDTSIDSRNTALGTVGIERIEGIVFLCIWPLSNLRVL